MQEAHEEAESHADFIRQQIQERAPSGVDENSRDPGSGCDHRWYGVRVPVLRELALNWKASHQQELTFGVWKYLLDTLYLGTSIDERQVAGMLLAAFPKFRRQLPLPELEQWLDQLVGWKEVDSSCQASFTSGDLGADWEAWQRFLIHLSQDENIHKRRASLVLLVKPIRSEDPRFLTLALQIIDALKHENDKLITKAVSWLLRTAVGQHRSQIEEYLREHRDSLPAIAIRETRRKLDTGKK